MVGLLTACSTGRNAAEVTASSNTGEVCDGNKAKGRLVFSFATYTKPLSGLDLTSAQEITTQQNTAFNTLANGFVPYLMEHQLTSVRNDGAYDFSEASPLLSNLDMVPTSLFNDNDDIHWVRIANKPPAFALCRSSQCEGLVEPFYKQTVTRGRDYNLNGDGARPVHGFFISEIKAPSFGSNQVVGSLINDTGINLGAFVASHYWMVPEIQKESFCKKMTGLNIDCLTYGHFPHHNPNENLTRLIAENKISGDEMLNQEVAQFQDGFSNLSSSSMWERMGLSGNRSLEYKSTIILFYSIMKNTTVTSKVNGPWSIKQASFNPNDFCRYAHERSDLSTR